MKVPATVIKINVLCLFSTVFLAMGLELLFGNMLEVKRFLWVNSVDNVVNLFCPSTGSFVVVPEKNHILGKNHCYIRIVVNKTKNHHDLLL